jgi:hypothetical protein
MMHFNDIGALEMFMSWAKVKKAVFGPTASG